jgi:hypothetical protein
MKGNRQLDDTQRATEVAAGAGDRLDDRRAEVATQLTQMRTVQTAQVARRVDARQN